MFCLYGRNLNKKLNVTSVNVVFLGYKAACLL